jgi:hypothetical protein
MNLFDDHLANLKKSDVGELYCPSNGTEGDMFFDGECEGCVYQSLHDEGDFCLTEFLCFYFETSDPEYPVELQINADGQPFCRRKSVLSA